MPEKSPECFRLPHCKYWGSLDRAQRASRADGRLSGFYRGPRTRRLLTLLRTRVSVITRSRSSEESNPPLGRPPCFAAPSCRQFHLKSGSYTKTGKTRPAKAGFCWGGLERGSSQPPEKPMNAPARFLSCEITAQEDRRNVTGADETPSGRALHFHPGPFLQQCEGGCVIQILMSLFGGHFIYLRDGFQRRKLDASFFRSREREVDVL